MTERSVRPALLLLLLLAFGLRVYQLDAQELRGDEAFGYFFALRDYGEIARATIDLQEPHPPLSYWLQRSWLTLLGPDAGGHSEYAVRFGGVWWGVLLTALIYRLARTLSLARISGLLALLAAALSPYLIWHAQDARMYSLSTALTLTATLAMAAWLQSRDRGMKHWLWAVLYVVTATAALLVHYFALFILAAHYLFVMGQGLLDRRYRWSLLPWLGIQALVGILYLPWLYLAAETLVGYGGNGDSPGLLEAGRRAFAAMGVGETFTGRPQLFLALVGLMLLAIGVGRLVRSGERGRRTAVLLLLYLAVPLAATWFGARQRPIFDARYLAAAAPPFFLLIGAAVGEAAVRGWQRGRGLLLTSVTLYVVLILGAVIGLSRQYHDAAFSKNRGWRELAAAVERLSLGLPPEQVRIVQNFPDPTLWYYYDGAVEHVVVPPAPQDAVGAAAQVDMLENAGVTRIVLPLQPNPDWDPGAIAVDAISAGGYLESAGEEIGVWPVLVYTAAHVAAPLPNPVRFGESIDLVAAGGLDGTLTPNELITPATRWSGPDTATAEDLKISLQLIGPDGSLVTQDDTALLAGAPVDAEIVHAHGLMLPGALPPGTYRLYAIVYSASSGARLGLADNEDKTLLHEWLLNGGESP